MDAGGREMGGPVGRGRKGGLGDPPGHLHLGKEA